ncbi:hypothetical protein KAU33_02880 [Candidatus Dependentiae bacterium]|nr:hypothetical protein [Candidatus Dependentiae bacterium]
MTGNIIEVILQPLSNILFYFVILSYFITFLFTVLFMISKKIFLGEISNIFFIISAILHIILVVLYLFKGGLFIFDSLFKVLLIVSAVIVVIYIFIELFYKIKMGGIFILMFILAALLILLVKPEITFKLTPEISIFNSVFYILLMLGYFIFIGSYINSFSIYIAAIAYPHIIKENIEIYLKAAKRFDILAGYGLGISILSRFIIFNQIEIVFVWKSIIIQSLSVILGIIIIRSVSLYKKLQNKKILLRFYKILGMIFWAAILFLNNVII